MDKVALRKNAEYFCPMKIQSPLSGFLVALDQVPDEVFSKRMVGDGLAIEPTDSILYSPIAGVVEYIHPSRHAVTLKSSEGLEILIHIGIDTVQLKGEGFKSFVRQGQKVNLGEKLIEFDFDLVSQKAKSMMTLILMTQQETHVVKLSQNLSQKIHTKANQSELFSVELKIASSQKKPSLSSVGTNDLSFYASNVITCELTTGIHARPAAALAQVAKNFNGEILIFKNEQFANLKSVVSILSLSVEKNDTVIFEAHGVDAKSVVEALQNLLVHGLADHHDSVSKPQTKSQLLTMNLQPAQKTNPFEFRGVMASPGAVYGKIKKLESKDVFVEKKISTESVAVELNKIESALVNAAGGLKVLIDGLKAGDDRAAIFEAHLELLHDPEIAAQTRKQIELGLTAESAWQTSTQEIKKTLESLNNEVMAGRAHDLHDVSQRVLKTMLGLEVDHSLLDLPSGENFILIAQNLTPSDMAFINPKAIKGLCTVEGGASSHVAIIARSMGIASIAAVDASVMQVSENTLAILDATRGLLKTKPTDLEITEVQYDISVQQDKLSKNKKSALLPAMTLDGHTIDVFANIGKLSEAKDAVDHGAEGVGLLRSEFLFLHRATAPSEAEQLEKYKEIISAFNHDQVRPVIIRTLDVGGDKPLSYLPMAAEENPFLGIRGLRLSLLSPDMFRTQLKALLQVKPISALQIMFPMVTTLSELIQAKTILAEECQKQNISAISVGIMIEVPSAALLAESFAPHVDFFSIGSNDLTQYTLAIDRGHRDLARMADGLHPSVLKLIKMTCDAAHKYKKMVGVCGGIAGDAQAVPLLIGLGVHELSVSVPAIPDVKAQIRKLKKSDCFELVTKALTLAEASDVRELITEKYL